MKYDYEGIKKQLYENNLIEVKKSTKTDWLRQKVHNFCANFRSIKEEKVLEEIKNNDIVAASFIKDPGRQNFYENTALNFLESMEIVKSVKKLPASGKKSLFVINGFLINGAQVVDKQINKSIDFEIILKNGIKIYASHKYTKDEGGAQDNQFHDLQNFLSEANRYYGGDYYFIAIADGEYYQRNNQKKLKYLENIATNEKVLVATMETFEEIVRALKK